MVEILLEDLRMLLRLGVAVVLALPLGWDRERAQRPAGLRTHILVSLSAALMVSLTAPMVNLHLHIEDERLRFDPMHILIAVMSGVAFLGAGTIVVSAKGREVKGLTTAGSIFATAAIGCCAGLERYALAIGATLIVMVVLVGLGRFEKWIHR
jgi:putative Mg2+ transporter-C (MgtC) family protein